MTRVELNSNSRDKEKMHTRLIRELILFQRIDQQLSDLTDTDRILRQAMQHAMTIVGADGGSIGIIESDEQSERMLDSQVFDGHDKPRHRQVPTNHPLLTVMLSGRGPIQMRGPLADQTILDSAVSIQLAVPARSQGQLAGLVTMIRRRANDFSPDDISFAGRLADRIAVVIEQKRLLHEIDETNKSKSEFVSLLSHELRVPMTSIKGFTDILLTGKVGPLSEQQHEFLKTIKRNVERMSNLVRDLGDFNRIDSGRERFNNNRLDVAKVVDEAVKLLGDSLEARQQELIVDVAPDLPEIYADSRSICRVLSYLITNACQYSPEGGTISVLIERNGDFAKARIADEGIGISKEDQDKLFTLFFRSDEGMVRQHQGWGLGLAVARKMVEAQGGELTFESELNQGSVFSFTVPLAE
jgi:signal transduction histidine kinase